LLYLEGHKQITAISSQHAGGSQYANAKADERDKTSEPLHEYGDAKRFKVITQISNY
jgi:hypothetical protein